MAALGEKHSSPYLIDEFHSEILEVAYGGRLVSKKLLSDARTLLFLGKK